MALSTAITSSHTDHTLKVRGSLSAIPTRLLLSLLQLFLQPRGQLRFLEHVRGSHPLLSPYDNIHHAIPSAHDVTKALEQLTISKFVLCGVSRAASFCKFLHTLAVLSTTGRH